MVYTIMKWHVKFTGKSSKQAILLNEDAMFVLQVLLEDLKNKGPAPGKNWPNYGKLHGKKNEDRRHCHILTGRPIYVCCWEVLKLERLIKVYYVGTHEKAPY